MTTSEIQIIDELIGNVKTVVKGALVICHYDGYLENGTKFDSSRDKGKPFQFVIGSGRVIKGWDIGIMGMKEGGKRKLFVPSTLAYGERQIGNIIPPHSNLNFEVEVLEVRTRDE